MVQGQAGQKAFDTESQPIVVHGDAHLSYHVTREADIGMILVSVQPGQKS
jgi:hypothetical protein